ncbi:hypothetical protein C8Q75DRAFT_712106 [Abortiporus biennis]|nr:hypothetical protein C8Q75DRAFT_712106 [Abortiporus biennis]
MNGGATCTDLLCVGGVVNGSTITYTLQSLNAAPLGWMAMGFGATMANSPMVIMWPNSDGSITLSQRKTNAEVMPTVDSNPPRQATLQSSLSSLTGANPKLVYTIPSTGSPGQETIIWAFGATNPGSSAVDATLVQHLNSGPISLDLSQTISSSSKDPTNPVFTIDQVTSGSAGSSSGTNGGSTTTQPVSSFHFPLLPFEKKIVAHAVLSMVGFIILLPAGALVARWTRTFTNMWFKGHWIIQLGLAAPVIIAGFALGVSAVETSGSPHLNDRHKKAGLAVFILYMVQLALGGLIHYVKPSSFTIDKKRPIQNYVHAVLGLLIIALAFYQVRTGIRTEWILTTGRAQIGNAANIVWYIWVVVVPVAYFAGLSLLPRQWSQERGGPPKSVRSFEDNSSMSEVHHSNGAEGAGTSTGPIARY